MKPVMRNITLVTLSSLALLATACGSNLSSNPSGYRELRKNGVPTDKTSYTPEPAKQVVKVEDPKLRVGNLIDIKTQGPLNFVEGEASEFLVVARVLQLKVNYELVLTGLPEGAVVEDAGPNAKKVKWTPKPGFIEDAKDSKSVKFEVELKQASKLDGPEQALFDAQTKKAAFEVLVSRTKENPVVQKVVGLDGVVQEGTKVNFSVEVRDPGAQSAVAPKLVIKKDLDSTQETVGVDGSDYVSVDPAQSQPTSTSPGIWVFHYIYDTSAKAAPRPSKLGSGNKQLAADEIPVRFKIEIQSPSRRSTTTSKEFRLKYNTQGQSAEFQVVQGDALTADIGSTVQIDIKVNSKISNGVVTVDQAGAQDLLNKTLPGGSKANIFRCKNNGSASVECRLGWKVPCDDSIVGSTQKLTVKAVNSVGAIGVESVLDRSISITKTKECTAANPTAGGK